MFKGLTARRLYKSFGVKWFRELKSALKSMVGFLNTYFELLQFIEIISITNKCNQ
jgi:hypothetical protein